MGQGWASFVGLGVDVAFFCFYMGCFRHKDVPLQRFKKIYYKKSYILMKRTVTGLLLAMAVAGTAQSETIERLKFGDMDEWVTRIVKESSILGGHTKNVYEIGPTSTDATGKPYYSRGGSPWATSNVLAKVVGITKTSNAVFPDKREGHGQCAKLTTMLEHCKAIGLINIDVLVAGSIFLGRMIEPIKSTKNPYSNMEMGISFNRRPKALQFDYKIEVPKTGNRMYSSGFGKKKTLPGTDKAEVFILLQRRWEDSDGNLYAKRVGTGRELYPSSSAGWVEGHRIPVLYGDITSLPSYKPFMGLISGEKSYYGRNSKGKMVPVKEVGWDDADATPTHMLVMLSAGSGEAYIGTIGLTLWVDNVSLVFD
jgi:hypothetical protein